MSTSAPRRRIWLLPLLVAVWTNLHGAASSASPSPAATCSSHGWRLAPRQTLAVGGASVLALLVTPAGPGSVRYYAGVFGNEAARRGTGLWSHPSLHQPLDVAMLLGLAALAALALRRRQPLWTYAALAGLALSTLSAARNGAWLALALVLPAALAGPATPGRAATAPSGLGRPTPLPALIGWVLVVTAACSAVLGVRARPVDPTPAGLVPAVRSAAGTAPVLAPEPLVERLAADGLTVWLGNPIDAFSRGDQAAYLDFLDGEPGGRAALDRVHVVVVERGSDPERLVLADPRWRAARTVGGWTAYTR